MIISIAVIKSVQLNLCRSQEYIPIQTEISFYIFIKLPIKE